MALEVQTQLLFCFVGLADSFGCLLDLFDLEISGGCPMKELSSGRRQSCFSTGCSEQLYGIFNILDIANDYEYQHA